jgi:hypothetical protein
MTDGKKELSHFVWFILIKDSSFPPITQRSPPPPDHHNPHRGQHRSIYNLLIQLNKKRRLANSPAFLVPATGVISNRFLEDLERIWALKMLFQRFKTQPLMTVFGDIDKCAYLHKDKSFSIGETP